MKTKCLLVATAAGTLTLGITTLPASALPGDTPATITVTAGTLSITVPTGPANLGSRANSVGRRARRRRAGPGAGERRAQPRRRLRLDRERHLHRLHARRRRQPIAASAVSYTAGTITKVGTATYTPNDPPNLTGVSPAVTTTGITGDNSATWNPTITVAVPVAWPPPPIRQRSPTRLSRDVRAAGAPSRRVMRRMRCLAALALTAVVAAPAASTTRRSTRGPRRVAAASDCGSSTRRSPPATIRERGCTSWITSRPGTVIHRRIEVSNTTASTAARRPVPRGGLHRRRARFSGADGHTPNDLSTWTSVAPGASDLARRRARDCHRDHRRPARRGPRGAVRRGVGRGPLGARRWRRHHPGQSRRRPPLPLRRARRAARGRLQHRLAHRQTFTGRPADRLSRPCATPAAGRST